ncbi:lysophospholipid acyltransferase family protein [Umezakia ovalisporum]|jgi:1-acyl-sn-glycerol-3-phosphate acyltransferase|uniref:1-acyl-sn-glycerol-3-phosphate acyltransferase n=2 Tax=Umezakia ovalisporum TaxID=75695 RepID=A0AA43GWR4_9CYAN|nr:1-acyl-sn-glycerol-3-phosphate acyltransferase [Umezakia ovalisporum]MBI1241035.1 1-acyl-sn-glycerol-3-phosphate acyltransferase [Nostoc sp. RI_552]MDH6055810.1 1-acyl-sn-glycerol-3-phosphate acyltransferase [Umezakia ovalisporum FSS-43]MDH6063156.1 1-acyl-sn-glycerol-3-phosphate acyltransferase [Umezakia ovalisporum FSS-62]MDH6068956.1 1-acyl-sn-glycerol-3-phosphate acyltransferase [Umezakia ovalisporum APH033B]MDH6070618.1 1-acyl-sn-glycerol-3-phosphate acyltransferase [Umezakia ovalispor
MSGNRPLDISRYFLAALSTQMFRYHENRIPKDASVLVVSNHRSFMDALVLMSALSSPIRFACHHYMGQVPIMREIVTGELGCFPLENEPNRQQSFFQQSQKILRSKQMVGVFPEGTRPMVTSTLPHEVGKFQRGFAHLALRSTVQDLAILPIAIASLQEVNTYGLPLRLLTFFDPSEPLFDQPGLHPLVIYRRVVVLIGHPYWVTPQHQQKYHGKQAKNVVSELTGHCHNQIATLLQKGCY